MTGRITRMLKDKNHSLSSGTHASPCSSTARSTDATPLQYRPRCHRIRPPEVMRTSPCWTHRCYGLSQVAIRPQLSCHVTLGFSRHVVTVLVITRSYDIKMGHSWMRWKGDDDVVVLALVLDSEGPWIILCDHVKVLHTYLGQLGHVSCRALSPSCGHPTPSCSQP
jgi:hypothetical protein